MIGLSSEGAAQQCIRHFDGRRWGAGARPIKAYCPRAGRRLAPLIVVLGQLPKGLCSRGTLEVAFEQAGFENEVTAFVVDLPELVHDF